MNYFQARETVELLSSVFNITAPELRWSERDARGHANYVFNTITIGPKISEWKSMEDTVLHEFTHILTYHRTPKILKSRIKFRVWQHGKMFQENLIEVILSWYGDISRYDFKGSEYVSVSRGVHKKLKENPNAK